MITILLAKIIELLKSISEKPAGGGTVEDISDQITIDYTKITESSASVFVTKYGSLINVNLNLLVSAAALSSGAVIISGLPKPKEDINTNLYNAEHMEYIGIKLDTDGNITLLNNWTSGRQGQGTFDYLIEVVT